MRDPCAKWSAAEGHRSLSGIRGFLESQGFRAVGEDLEPARFTSQAENAGSIPVTRSNDCWSRRIDEDHRPVYFVDGEDL